MCISFHILEMQISTVAEEWINFILNSEVIEKAFRAYQCISFVSPE